MRCRVVLISIQRKELAVHGSRVTAGEFGAGYRWQDTVFATDDKSCCVLRRAGTRDWYSQTTLKCTHAHAHSTTMHWPWVPHTASRTCTDPRQDPARRGSAD